MLQKIPGEEWRGAAGREEIAEHSSEAASSCCNSGWVAQGGQRMGEVTSKGMGTILHGRAERQRAVFAMTNC